MMLPFAVQNIERPFLGYDGDVVDGLVTVEDERFATNDGYFLI